MGGGFYILRQKYNEPPHVGCYNLTGTGFRQYHHWLTKERNPKPANWLRLWVARDVANFLNISN
jgi:hypothetical protein